MRQSYFVGVATISDRCSQGLAEDKSGPKLVDFVQEELVSLAISLRMTTIPKIISKLSASAYIG